MRQFLKLGGQRLLCLLLLAALLGAGLTACTPSKVTKDNFEKVKLGMTQAEVQDLLGPPSEATGLEIPVFSGATAKWVRGDVTITIQFVNGKVMAKEFSKEGKK